jgi:hypothetical protein
MWNPLEYPNIRYDDGTYIGRALHVLVTRGPQEGIFYDHPYFGQILLAGIFWLVDYPSALSPSADSNVVAAVKTLWLVPKILIGSLAVIDTFLIYKITERRYNSKTIAFIASVLFAVMPMWWSLRVMFLESLLLPLLLSSILFATYTKHPKDHRESKKKNITLVLISGVLMGLAIFTKIPIFAFIPLVAYVIFTNNNKSFKTLGLWLIPVVIIPLIWPTYALYQGHLDAWWGAIYYQTHRQDEGMTLGNAIIKDFSNVPIFFWLGLSGLIFTIIKRDYFLVLWAVPFLIFLNAIGFVRDFHLVPLMPAICIATSRLILGLSAYIPYQKVRQILPFNIISVIAIVGLINIVPQLTLNGMNENDEKFTMTAIVSRYLKDNKNDNISVISSHVYSWIPKYVFGLGNVEYRTVDDISPTINRKVVLIVDSSFRLVTSQNDAMGKSLRGIYDARNTNETMIINVGRDKIVLPEVWFPNYTLQQQQELDLLNEKHSWKPRKDAYVSQTDGNLIILSHTNGTEETSRYAIMKTQLENFTKSPLLLSLEYGTKSSNTNTTYFIEIREKNGTGNNSRDMTFKYMLDYTQGKITRHAFFLPPEIADRPVEFRLSINSKAPGEHVLAVKRAYITLNGFGSI